MLKDGGPGGGAAAAVREGAGGGEQDKVNAAEMEARSLQEQIDAERRAAQAALAAIIG